jgi:hypothetical protein
VALVVAVASVRPLGTAGRALKKRLVVVAVVVGRVVIVEVAVGMGICHARVVDEFGEQGGNWTVCEGMGSEDTYH